MASDRAIRGPPACRWVVERTIAWLNRYCNWLGTLVHTDTFAEGMIAVIWNVRALSKLASLFVGSRAGLKERVAELAVLDPALLPYNEQLVAYLRA